MNETPTLTTAQRLVNTALFLTEGDCEAAIAALDDAMAQVLARLEAAKPKAEGEANEPTAA